MADKQQPAVGAAAVVIRDGYMLLSQRKAGKLQGWWCVPGGAVPINTEPDKQGAWRWFPLDALPERTLPPLKTLARTETIMKAGRTMTAASKRSVIGLVGKKLAGKDTLADALVDRYGAVKLGIGLLVVEELAETLGVPPTKIEQFKEPYYRKPLQDLGNKMRKSFGNDFWILRMVGVINALLKNQDRVVVTGIRLLQEADTLDHLFGARLIRVSRTDRVGATGDPDITETEQDRIRTDLDIVSESALDTRGRWVDEVAKCAGWNGQ